MLKKWLLSVGLGLALTSAVPVQAADIITFDPDGAGGMPAQQITGLDFSPGTALVVGPDATPSVGDIFTVYYQAKLAVTLPNDATSFANGDGGQYFTIVAAFREVVTGVGTLGSVQLVTSDFQPGGVNFLRIYHNTSDADDLTGVCFVCGNVVMTAVINGDEFSSIFGTNNGAAIQNLDQFQDNDYDPAGPANATTLPGNGLFNINANIISYDTNYFSGLAGATISLGNFNGNTHLPFDQVDPAACLHATAIAGPLLAPTCSGPGAQVGVGQATLGGTIPNTTGAANVFQTDQSASFTTVVGGENPIPEPATMTLLGLGLLGSAAARRRKSNKK